MNDYQLLQDSFSPYSFTDIGNLIAWIMIPTIIISIFITFAFVIYFIRRIKIERAILDIRDGLEDIKTILENSSKPKNNTDIDLAPAW